LSLSPPPSSHGRCLGLDLLRATAVLMVLVSHWTSHFGYWFGVHVPVVVDALGDTGVEIFFALSGFLIGRILIGIAATRPGWSDYGVFMIRRAMRTLPLYFLWLAILLCVFPPRQDFVVTALRFMTLTQNLVADMPPDYYYVVTWSLTIEEWFYLLFGASLIFLSRQLGGSRALPWCLALFMLAPLLLRLGYHERGALVFFRIDEIAYGVLMARLYVNQSRIYRDPWLPLTAGLTLIGTALSGMLPLPASVVVPLTSNAEVIGGALCLPAALRLAKATWWFEAPVRWIAARSYALYLIHLTILVDIAETRLFEPGLMSALGCAVIAVTVPLVLAELSYRFLEEPVLRLRPRQNRGGAGARVAMGHGRFGLAGAAKSSP
jgi:peptidoglycan/LPS O-acetylase OafA/YrhL